MAWLEFYFLLLDALEHYFIVPPYKSLLHYYTLKRMNIWKELGLLYKQSIKIPSWWLLGTELELQLGTCCTVNFKVSISITYFLWKVLGKNIIFQLFLILIQRWWPNTKGWVRICQINKKIPKTHQVRIHSTSNLAKCN